MHYGTAFSPDWVGDVEALKDGATRLDAAGFDYVTLSGHVLSAAEGRYPDRPLSTYAVPFRDPFVLFAVLSGVTSRIHFRTGILILPLFPTVSVAKQSAELAIMSGGRFDLGVGISWNEAEYEAMGQDLHTRGRRFEEQLEVLRLLWSQPIVDYHGDFHDIDALGLGALPPPIPIWIGCAPTPALLARVARHGDGWMPLGQIDPTEPIALLRKLAGGRKHPVAVASRIAARPKDLPGFIAESAVLVRAGVDAIAIGPPPGASLSAGIDAVIAGRTALVAEFGD